MKTTILLALTTLLASCVTTPEEKRGITRLTGKVNLYLAAGKEYDRTAFPTGLTEEERIERFVRHYPSGLMEDKEVWLRQFLLRRKSRSFCSLP